MKPQTREAGHSGLTLTSPGVGWFVPCIAPNSMIGPGARLGTLETLGRVVAVHAPASVAHQVHTLADGKHTRFAVEFGQALCTLREATGGTGAQAPAVHTHQTAEGVTFRAPMSGRIYLRPAPDQPPFVKPGDEVQEGATLCLLEVMKTFHRVTLRSGEVRLPARVKQLLVTDEADVVAQQALVEFEP